MQIVPLAIVIVEHWHAGHAAILLSMSLLTGRDIDDRFREGAREWGVGEITNTPKLRLTLTRF